MMSDIPIISVILAVRNGEKFIREALDSVLRQTFRSFELIVVVNCSIDNTLDVVKSIDDNRIRVFETQIGQLSFNLNYGVLQSRGKYIARMDADDIALPNRFEIQISYIENFDLDVVGSNVDYVDEDGNRLGSFSYPEVNKQIRKQIFYRSVIAHPSVIIKREVLLGVSCYLGGRYAQDYDLWLRIMRNPDIKFYNVQQSLLLYRIHKDQSKGNSNSFAEVAGYLLKEAFYTKNINYFLGSVLYSFKFFFR